MRDMCRALISYIEYFIIIDWIESECEIMLVPHERVV